MAKDSVWDVISNSHQPNQHAKANARPAKTQANSRNKSIQFNTYACWYGLELPTPTWTHLDPSEDSIMTLDIPVGITQSRMYRFAGHRLHLLQNLFPKCNVISFDRTWWWNDQCWNDIFTVWPEVFFPPHKISMLEPFSTASQGKLTFNVDWSHSYMGKANIWKIYQNILCSSFEGKGLHSF